MNELYTKGWDLMESKLPNAKLIAKFINENLNSRGEPVTDYVTSNEQEEEMKGNDKVIKFNPVSNEELPEPFHQHYCEYKLKYIVGPEGAKYFSELFTMQSKVIDIATCREVFNKIGNHRVLYHIKTIRKNWLNHYCFMDAWGNIIIRVYGTHGYQAGKYYRKYELPINYVLRKQQDKHVVTSVKLPEPKIPNETMTEEDHLVFKLIKEHVTNQIVKFYEDQSFTCLENIKGLNYNKTGWLAIAGLYALGLKRQALALQVNVNQPLVLKGGIKSDDELLTLYLKEGPRKDKEYLDIANGVIRLDKEGMISVKTKSIVVSEELEVTEHMFHMPLGPFYIDEDFNVVVTYMEKYCIATPSKDIAKLIVSIEKVLQTYVNIARNYLEHKFDINYLEEDISDEKYVKRVLANVIAKKQV